MNNKHCIGCEDNFYNDNNNYGIKKCWCLDDAKLIERKQVGINDVPPWNQQPIIIPNCYKKNGYVFVSPDRTT